MNAEKIADEARKAISKYCYEECKAYCCRKGYLILTLEETDLFSRYSADFKKEELKKLENGDYSLNLQMNGFGCPMLGKDFKCTIHKEEKRPHTCKQFPLFVDEENKILRLSSRCLAVREGKLYPYIAQIKSMGYCIIRGNPLADYGMHNTANIN